jgi:hypothetical protein
MQSVRRRGGEIKVFLVMECGGCGTRKIPRGSEHDDSLGIGDKPDFVGSIASENLFVSLFHLLFHCEA